MSKAACAECGRELPGPDTECPDCSRKYAETDGDGNRSHRSDRGRRFGMIAVIVLILATAARVLVKFLPAIRGFLHLK
jgi:hypothetical protein